MNIYAFWLQIVQKQFMNASPIHFVTLSLAQKNENKISSWKCLAGGEQFSLDKVELWLTTHQSSRARFGILYFQPAALHYATIWASFNTLHTTLMLIGSVFKDGTTPPLELIDQEQNPTAGNSQFFNPLRCTMPLSGHCAAHCIQL